MKAAFKKAKSTLHNFLNLVNKVEDKNSIYGAYIKVEDGGETEFLWVTDVKKHNKEFYIGHVISTPMLIQSIKKGDTIGYKTSDIFDWQRYDKEQKITLGAFTICALINQNSKEDREYINKNGIQCSQ